VGAAFHGLALALARGGHDVTLVYVHDSFRRGTVAEWEAYFARHGIRFVHVPQPHPGPVWYGGRKEASLDCYRWLAAHGPFDVIHSHEWLGLPYYALVAKRLGLAFQSTTLCGGNARPDALEPRRRGTAGRDARGLGGGLHGAPLGRAGRRRREPEPLHARLDALPTAGGCPRRATSHKTSWKSRARPALDPPASRPVRELVFFGRLDRRKGVPFFCDVVDRLQARGRSEVAVTFLGSSVHFDGKASDEYVRARAAAWRRPPHIATDMSREEALAYLAGDGRLAVMPASADNLPCTVHECIQLGIPFLASDVGGTPELVAPADRASVLCTLDADRFAGATGRNRRAWPAPGTRRGRCARERRALASLARHAHERVARAAAHRSLCARSSPAERAAEGGAPTADTRAAAEPFVSVCIAHYERPALLAQTLAALERQTYAELRGHRQRRRQLARAIVRRPRRDRATPCEARVDAAARAESRPRRRTARGGGKSARRLPVFVDDDDVPSRTPSKRWYARPCTREPTCSCPRIEAFSARASRTRPHPCAAGSFRSAPRSAPSLIYPEIGGAMIFVRKEAYFACGGFPLERDVDEDWELLLTLVLDGYDLDVVPEPLLWYRDQEHSRSRADNRFRRTRSRSRAVRAHAAAGAARPGEPRARAARRRRGQRGVSRRLERVRQVLDRRQGRKVATAEK
jgi:glycosyltransferase involved in cell wall biosynthesis